MGEEDTREEDAGKKGEVKEEKYSTNAVPHRPKVVETHHK